MVGQKILRSAILARRAAWFLCPNDRNKLVTKRTTRKTVTFRRPFDLSGVGGVEPGTYDVDTDEESIDSLSILAYRRVATFIQIHRNGDTQVFPIDPVELDTALMRDAGLTVAQESKPMK